MPWKNSTFLYDVLRYFVKTLHIRKCLNLRISYSIHTNTHTHILLSALLCHVHLGTEIGYWPSHHLQCHKWADRWRWLHDGWLVYSGALPETFPTPTDNSRRWKFDNHVTFSKQELLNEATITTDVLRMTELKRLVTNMGISEKRIKYLNNIDNQLDATITVY